MEQENSKAKFKLPLLILVVLVVIAAGGVWAWHNHKNNSGSKSTSSTGNWTTYKNDKYGLMFDYLKSWGTPQVLASSGEYQLSFAAQNSNATKDSVKREISVSFGSNKGDLTKSDVQQALNGNKSSFAKYDNSSYAVLNSDPKSNISSELILYQIVNLSKLNVSAAIVDSETSGSAGCTDNIVQSSDVCVTQSYYDDLSKFAKSIKSTQ